MIGNINYNEMEQIAKQMKSCVDTLNVLIKGKENNDLENFVSIVERYEKFLFSNIELNKAADEALENLKNNK